MDYAREIQCKDNYLIQKNVLMFNFQTSYFVQTRTMQILGVHNLLVEKSQKNIFCAVPPETCHSVKCNLKTSTF